MIKKLLIFLVLLYFYDLACSTSFAASTLDFPLQKGINQIKPTLLTGKTFSYLPDLCPFSYKTQSFWKNSDNRTVTPFETNIKYTANCRKYFDHAVINPKVGITHVAGLYPDRRAEKDFLTYGLRDGLNLGFKTFEIYLSPETCIQRANTYPLGYYQDLDYCQNCSNDNRGTCNSTITDIAKSGLYEEVFNLPFDTLFITAESFNKNSAHAWLISSVNSIPKSQLDSLYDEFNILTKYLYDRFGGEEKTIIFQTPNELDWQLLGNKGNPGPAVENMDADAFAIQNAIDYLNTIQRAVDDAKTLYKDKKLKVFHSCEVNMVTKAMEGKNNATNAVVPKTNCDLYGYSAYGAYLGMPAGQDKLTEALNYLKSKAPDSPTFGADNVYISEFGVLHDGNIPVGNSVYLTEDNAATLLDSLLQKSLSWGVPYFLYWQLYDNSCSKLNPAKSDCNGWWLRKPDNTLSKVYGIFQKYKAYQ